MKRKLFLVLILLVILVGCSNEKKLTLGESNTDKSDLSVKVIIDQINIRSKASIDSEIIGYVKMDSFFNVLDYVVDDYYVWLHIKTNNNIDGYIATEKEDPYVEYVSGMIDIEKPKLTLLNDRFKLKNRSDLNDEYVKENIEYSDNSGESFLSYSIDYDDKTFEASNQYVMQIKVTDAAGNYTEKQVIVQFTNEVRISNGEWKTYDEVLSLRNILNSICSKYGEATDKICYLDVGRIDYDSELIVFYPNESEAKLWCSYDLTEYNAKVCHDEVNYIDYDVAKEKIKKNEEAAIKITKKIKEEFNKQGYEFKDILWQ